MSLLNCTEGWTNSDLQLFSIVGSGVFSHLPFHQRVSLGFRSDQFRLWEAMVLKAATGTEVLLETGSSISMKLLSRRKCGKL